MCGIFGWDLRKTKVNVEQRAMIAAILSVSNDTRGGDSWGIWNAAHLMKGLGDISSVAVKMVKQNVVMAHTRKATTGAITVPNAHPFSIGDIIGAHNGMISNHEEMNKKYERTFEVDSMQIFGHLAEGKSLKELTGYGAIEFIRKAEGRAKINLCKLSNGDLTICGLGKDVNNYQGVIWSSNGNHVEMALKTANIEYFKFEVKQGNVYSVDDGQLSLVVDEDNKIVELELGTRYATIYTRHGYAPNYHPTPTAGTRTKLTKEEYKAMLEGMTDEEEREFFDLWMKHEGMEFEETEVEVEEVTEIEDTDEEIGTEKAAHTKATESTVADKMSDGMVFNRETRQWETPTQE